MMAKVQSIRCQKSSLFKYKKH